MLTYVDTLIGFAGVMLLLSLLVTLLVQAAISILNLRGLSLLWGVALVVERAAPGLKNTLRAWELAWRVLTHPALSPAGRLAPALRSDELLAALTEVSGPGKPETSFGLRGAFLRWMRKVWEKSVDEGDKAMQAVSADAEAVKAWFKPVMDRTTERFVARTRLITFVVAAALAFGLHIDSVALLRQISGNPELRARLAQSAEATMKVADDVAVRGAKGATLATDALEQAAADEPKVKLEAAIPARLSQRAEGKAWLDANVKDEGARASLEAAYDKRYDAAVKARLPELYAAAARVKDEIGAAQLDILATKHEPWRLDREWLSANSAHVFGVIMTALFLSLGAPFWYNMLRQLGNLRPLLAGKVDEDEKAKG